MGQEDVLFLLKKHKGTWFDSKTITKNIEPSRPSVTVSLLKLRKSKSVDFKAIDKIWGEKPTYAYRHKK